MRDNTAQMNALPLTTVEHTGEDSNENFLLNNDSTPPVIGQFYGCDLVTDDDIIPKEIQQDNAKEGLEIEDNLEALVVQPTVGITDTMEDGNQGTLFTENSFSSLVNVGEDLHEDEVESSPSKRKRKKNKSPIHTANKALHSADSVIGICIGEDGLTRVSTKKSSRLAGLPPAPPLPL